MASHVCTSLVRNCSAELTCPEPSDLGGKKNMCLWAALLHEGI